NCVRRLEVMAIRTAPWREQPCWVPRRAAALRKAEEGPARASPIRAGSYASQAGYTVAKHVPSPDPEKRLRNRGRPYREPREANRLSFPRRREGGFTFEVQQFGKDLGRGLPAEALPGRVIVESGELLQLPRRDGAQVGLARQQPP